MPAGLRMLSVCVAAGAATAAAPSTGSAGAGWSLAITSPWTTVATHPDLGNLTGSRQQPVDFAMWRARNGRWQLWSCVRGTKVGGETRLFYRWQSPAGGNLTTPQWPGVGVAMEADPAVGETPGGLQAPHVVLDPADNKYHMLFGTWEWIASAVSDDGVSFTRVVDNRTGRDTLFREADPPAPAPPANTRDPMLLPRHGGGWHAYYVTTYGDFHRETDSLADAHGWSVNSTRVAFGGNASGDGPWSAECVHVIDHTAVSGLYFLLRTEHYGEDARTNVYASADPTDFGVGAAADAKWVQSLPVAAPEVVWDERGDMHAAALLPTLDGIQVARLEFFKR